MNGDISCEKESILSTMKPSKAILKLTSIKPTLNLFKTVMDIGIPTAVVQICLAAVNLSYKYGCLFSCRK